MLHASCAICMLYDFFLFIVMYMLSLFVIQCTFDARALSRENL